MAYITNKGVGKKVEFKGLQSQYLLYFAAAFFGAFVLFVIMNFLKIPNLISLVVTGGGAAALMNYIFKMNKKYGTYGLAKQAAHRYQPRFIISRKPIYKILELEKEKTKCKK
jgi:hypothetical protein